MRSRLRARTGTVDHRLDYRKDNEGKMTTISVEKDVDNFKTVSSHRTERYQEENNFQNNLTAYVNLRHAGETFIKQLSELRKKEGHTCSD
jgi:hypothetical protein